MSIKKSNLAPATKLAFSTLQSGSQSEWQGEASWAAVQRSAEWVSHSRLKGFKREK